MRDYNEVTNAVLRRRDEQIAKDRRRAVIIKRCASAAAACCAAAVIGTGIVKYDRNIFTQPEITNVSPAETTTVFSPDNESITTTYNTNSATKITTALSEAAADNTRKRAETKVTSTVQSDAICTVTLMNMRADTASKNNAVTSSAHNAAQAATTTETQVIVPLHEERIDMQRIPAFLSALTASMSAVISNTNTEYHVGNDRYPNQKNGIENIRRDGLLTDINADGTSDLTDCLLLSLYCMDFDEKDLPDNGISIPADVRSRIAGNADYNGDGRIGYDDAYILICNYLLDNRISYSDVSPVTYDPSFSGSINLPWIFDSNETSFARMVSDLSHQLLIDRYIIEDMVDQNIISLDVNEDGKVDITDLTYLKINGENYLENYTVPVEGGVATAPRPHTIELPDNIRKNCDAVYYARPFVYYDNSYEVSRFISGLESYFASHMILMPEYFENDFYESIIKYSGEYSIGDNLYHSAVETGVIPEDDSYFRFDNEVFENGFKTYYENVLSGRQKAPDLNMDGITDHKDYDLAYDYILEIAANNDEGSLKMPVDVWRNISTNCDLNQNGTSGDIYDIFIVQMYVLLTEDSSSEISESHSYLDNHINDNDSSDAELYCSGDVNCDGVVDMADAVMIMQYLSNPSKFPISDRGRINGNVSESGYGITVSDVTAIQHYLLNSSNNQS